MRDFNEDGFLDLAAALFAIATSHLGPDKVSVLPGDGVGGFGAASDFPVGDIPASLVVGDFNEDGFQDLASANQNSNDVSVLLGLREEECDDGNHTNGDGCSSICLTE